MAIANGLSITIVCTNKNSFDLLENITTQQIKYYHASQQQIEGLIAENVDVVIINGSIRSNKHYNSLIGKQVANNL